MRKLVTITTLIGGILFIVVPRYILPACEYVGFPHMHCSDTAQAERVIGAMLIVVSCLTFFVKLKTMPLVSALLSIVLFGLAFWLPDYFGYCQSPRMPCHYGMVPSVRFISIVGILIMIGVIFRITKSYGKKGSS